MDGQHYDFSAACDRRRVRGSGGTFALRQQEAEVRKTRRLGEAVIDVIPAADLPGVIKRGATASAWAPIPQTGGLMSAQGIAQT